MCAFTLIKMSEHELINEQHPPPLSLRDQSPLFYFRILLFLVWFHARRQVIIIERCCALDASIVLSLCLLCASIPLCSMNEKIRKKWNNSFSLFFFFFSCWCLKNKHSETDKAHAKSPSRKVIGNWIIRRGTAWYGLSSPLLLLPHAQQVKPYFYTTSGNCNCNGNGDCMCAFVVVLVQCYGTRDRYKSESRSSSSSSGTIKFYGGWLGPCNYSLLFSIDIHSQFLSGGVAMLLCRQRAEQKPKTKHFEGKHIQFPPSFAFFFDDDDDDDDDECRHCRHWGINVTYELYCTAACSRVVLRCRKSRGARREGNNRQCAFLQLNANGAREEKIKTWSLPNKQCLKAVPSFTIFAFQGEEGEKEKTSLPQLSTDKMRSSLW